MVFNRSIINKRKTEWDEAIKSIAKQEKRAIRAKSKIPSLWPDGSVKPQKK
ncbi:MAG: hypothetical protein ABRQ38_10150 [Candidatus Eremiobacterota bacterium]